MFDPVGAVGFFRKEAPLNLVASLGSGFKEREAVVDGVFDGLVVTEFEVQEAVVLEASPVCLLYTSPSPRDVEESRMPSSA